MDVAIVRRIVDLKNSQAGIVQKARCELPTMLSHARCTLPTDSIDYLHTLRDGGSPCEFHQRGPGARVVSFRHNYAQPPSLILSIESRNPRWEPIQAVYQRIHCMRIFAIEELPKR